MSKSFKVAALVAVTAMFLAAPVFAPSVYGQSSPTGTATAGVFTTDVEDSMDVHYYSGVEFDKWAGFIGNNGLPSLGYATRFGDLYLGAWYNGNILSTNSTEVQQVVSDYDLTTQLFTDKTTTLNWTDKYTDSLNGLDVLIGVAGMGIKVGFVEALRVYDYPSITSTVTEDATGTNKSYTNDYIVDDYSRIQGYMTPSLEWGMSIEAGDITIRPKVALAFGIIRDTNILNVRGTGTPPSYSTVNGDKIGTETINSTGTINDYLKPEIAVGAGFELSSGATIGIEYGIGFDIYSNNYDASGFGGTAAGTVDWTGATKSIDRSLATTVTTTEAVLHINEKTNIQHSITPSFYYSSEITDGLNLGFSASIPVGIGVSSSIESWNWKQTTKTEYNNAALKAGNNRTENASYSNNGLTETTEFSIGLSAAIGASYALIPGRFTVNAGIGITPVNFTSTTEKLSRESINQTRTSKTYDADGKLTSETVAFEYWDSNTQSASTATTDQVRDSVKVTNTWAACTAVAAGGFTFNFNDNVALDMSVYGYGSTPGYGFTLSLTTVQVLFGFKF